jgi:hypothetical protein
VAGGDAAAVLEREPALDNLGEFRETTTERTLSTDFVPCT